MKKVIAMNGRGEHRMSILIKGMDMPKRNSALIVLIYSDGRVFTGRENDDEYSAVEVATSRRVDEMDTAIATLVNLPSAQPETPPYVAEIESEYEKWVSIPYINKPLAKALYEVWKKHDREDVSRNG